MNNNTSFDFLQDMKKLADGGANVCIECPIKELPNFKCTFEPETVKGDALCLIIVEAARKCKVFAL